MNYAHGRFQLDQVYLLLTRKCNLSCSHCIRSSNSTFTEMIEKNLAFKIIDELSSIRSDAVVLISGGEPSLHPEFYEIVVKSAESFRKVVVNTNGLRFNQLKNIAALENVSIQISLDGDEESHNMIRGAGTFRKTLLHIDKLSKLGINVMVASTVTKHNIHSISALDHSLSDISFNYWNVKRVVGSGRADDEDDITTPEWNDFVFEFKNTAINHQRLRIAPMFSETAIYNPANDDIEPKTMDLLAQNCGTGRSKLYINPNGTVYPCACMEDNITGDFQLNTADNILNELSNLSIEPRREATCHTCSAWKLCRGGCPGASMRSKFPNFGDPRCSHASKSVITYEI